MAEFDKIYLAWRKGSGSRRHLVGLLEKRPDNKHIFEYLPEAKDLYINEGFIPYFEFPDLYQVYNSNVVEIFGQRLMQSVRPDIKRFYEFWEVDEDKANDKFYLLGKTQGLTSKDSFEFLADYHHSENTHFVTDLAGLTHYNHPKGTLAIGDTLRFELEPENEYDVDAVKVFKDEIELGYIKKIHCRIFNQPGAENLKLTVRAIEQNGFLRKAFILVEA